MINAGHVRLIAQPKSVHPRSVSLGNRIYGWNAQGRSFELVSNGIQMIWKRPLLVLLVLTSPVLPPAIARDSRVPLSPEGRRLRAKLDRMDVEHRWLPNRHVDWKTGKPDGKTVRSGPRTHCSAFVAAACVRLKVPMLLPPPQTYLSNRQQDWLLGKGRGLGWREVSALRAQQLANKGYVVLASWKNHENDGYHRGAGHIAIVRPQLKEVSMVRSRGPQLTQAGGRNYKTTSVAVGFRGRAWKNKQVRYFAHLRRRVK